MYICINYYKAFEEMLKFNGQEIEDFECCEITNIATIDKSYTK